MKLPDNYMPRKGDVITVTGTVVYDVHEGTKFVFLDVGDDHGDLGVPFEAVPRVCQLLKRAWRVGDLVECPSQDVRGEVALIDGDWVCMKAHETTEGGMVEPASGLFVFGWDELVAWEKPLDVKGADVKMVDGSDYVPVPAEPPPPTGW